VRGFQATGRTLIDIASALRIDNVLDIRIETRSRDALVALEGVAELLSRLRELVRVLQEPALPVLADLPRRLIRSKRIQSGTSNVWTKVALVDDVLHS
jgi:hypothetical protein